MSENAKTSVFHWGATDMIPVTNFQVASSILVTDCYISTQPLNIRSKLEFELKPTAVDILEKFMQFCLGNLGDIPANMGISYSHNFNEFKTWVGSTDYEKLYLTVPLVGIEKNSLNQVTHLSNNLDLKYTERIYSTLINCTVLESKVPKNILSSKIANYFLPVGKIATDDGRLIINGVPTNPCDLCIHKDKKIGNYCIYFNGDYECLFTNSSTIIDGELTNSTMLATVLNNIPAQDIEMMDTAMGMKYENSDDYDNEYLDSIIEQMCLQQEKDEEDRYYAYRAENKEEKA